ncbi:hypothetical protein NCT2013_00190 [Enterobacter sp. M4-VN]|nr:hypothetical protein NCT2013_00190 [Enterobacter sp. M4-VN]
MFNYGHFYYEYISTWNKENFFHRSTTLCVCFFRLLCGGDGLY